MLHPCLDKYIVALTLCEDLDIDKSSILFYQKRKKRVRLLIGAVLLYMYALAEEPGVH